MPTESNGLQVVGLDAYRVRHEMCFWADSAGLQ